MALIDGVLQFELCFKTQELGDHQTGLMVTQHASEVKFHI